MSVSNALVRSSHSPVPTRKPSPTNFRAVLDAHEYEARIGRSDKLHRHITNVLTLPLLPLERLLEISDPYSFPRELSPIAKFLRTDFNKLRLNIPKTSGANGLALIHSEDKAMSYSMENPTHNELWCYKTHTSSLDDKNKNKTFTRYELASQFPLLEEPHTSPYRQTILLIKDKAGKTTFHIRTTRKPTPEFRETTTINRRVVYDPANWFNRFRSTSVIQSATKSLSEAQFWADPKLSSPHRQVPHPIVREPRYESGSGQILNLNG